MIGYTHFIMVKHRRKQNLWVHLFLSAHFLSIFFPEMIGEIKKAAEIREKAFLSQISSFISSVNLKVSELLRNFGNRYDLIIKIL